MLRGIENLPEYAALLDRLMESLPPAILANTGSPVDIKGFVFLSAPQTHTPLHFDAEYNVLFQVAGTKTFATYPPREPFLSRAEREAYQDWLLEVIGETWTVFAAEFENLWHSERTGILYPKTLYEDQGHHPACSDTQHKQTDIAVSIEKGQLEGAHARPPIWRIVSY